MSRSADDKVARWCESSSSVFGHDLQRLARSRAKSYAEADGYPHTIIDGFWESGFFERIMSEVRPMQHEADFPKAYSLGKRGRMQDFTPAVSQALEHLKGKPFQRFLQQLTQIHPVLPDPGNYGGGLHSTSRGGCLPRHLDFTQHRLKPGHDPVWRRINLIVFLNEDWPEEWGGHCFLSRPDRSVFAKILPVANRAVLFNTSSKSWHGQPKALNCPHDRHRVSMTAYYYSDQKADDQQTVRSTLYQP